MNFNEIIAKIRYNEETIELMQNNITNGYMIAASQEIIDLTVAENAQLKHQLSTVGVIVM